MAYIFLRPFVAGDEPNKQTRNETLRGVSQQVRLGTMGMPKYLVTKPIENQVNILTMLVTRIKA